MFKEQIKSIIEIEMLAGRYPPEHVNDELIHLFKHSIYESAFEACAEACPLEGTTYANSFKFLDHYKQYIPHSQIAKTLMESGLMAIEYDFPQTKELIDEFVVMQHLWLDSTTVSNYDGEINIQGLTAERVILLIQALTPELPKTTEQALEA